MEEEDDDDDDDVVLCPAVLFCVTLGCKLCNKELAVEQHSFCIDKKGVFISNILISNQNNIYPIS